MKKRKELMTGIAAVLFSAYPVQGQVCTPTPDCGTMGYNQTEEQCIGLSAVRCPYDTNKLFCTSGQTGGDVNVGDILYSDGSTSSELINSKVPIGVVFYVTNARKDILAVALQDGDVSPFNGYRGFTMYMAITRQTKIYEDENSAIEDMDGKTSVDEILKNTTLYSEYLYEQVKNYKTVGTNRANWFVPSAGQLKKLLDNLYAVNTALSKISTAKIMHGEYISSTFGGCTYGVETSSKNSYCSSNGSRSWPGCFWFGSSDSITTSLNKKCSSSSDGEGEINGGYYFVIRDVINYRPIINVGNIGAACEAKCSDLGAQRGKCAPNYYQVESGDDGCGGVCYRCYKGKAYHTTSACTGCTQNDSGIWLMEYTLNQRCAYKTGEVEYSTHSIASGSAGDSYEACQDECSSSIGSSIENSDGFCEEVTGKQDQPLMFEGAEFQR